MRQLLPRAASRLLALAALLACAVAVLAAPAAATPVRRAPSGLAFYTPPRPLPAGPNGTVIWSRSVASPLTSAGRTTLVLYRSQTAAGAAVAVSGQVSVPRGRAPRGGWPVISWAHGTTGIADRCAPTRSPRDAYTAYVAPQLNAWLRAGYAIARTDYQGLGTPGTHQYLIGRSEGRGVVDIVRAARRLDARLNNRWVIAGHSQGGHAALFAAAEAPARAPELRFRGVTAFAPASHLLEQARALPILRAPSPLSGLAALIVGGAAAATPTVSVPAIASDRALPLFPQLGLSCIQQLGSSTSFGAIPPAELVRPGADLNPLYRVLGAQNPALRITAPVVVVQGDADGTVLKGFTDQLAPELRAKGDRLTYRVLPGVDHGSVVARDAAATLAWLRARLG